MAEGMNARYEKIVTVLRLFGVCALLEKRMPSPFFRKGEGRVMVSKNLLFGSHVVDLGKLRQGLFHFGFIVGVSFHFAG
jgi:hypothetical protein